MAIAPKPTAPAPAVANAPARPAAPPPTTAIAFITAINAGTSEAIAGTNAVILDRNIPLNTFAATVPTVLTLLAMLCKDVSKLSNALETARIPFIALLESTTSRVRCLFGIERNIALNLSIAEIAEELSTSRLDLALIRLNDAICLRALAILRWNSEMSAPTFVSLML
ncbi:hypothetical protein BUY27_08345 [Staphylococcus cohnii]|nr:hypothetical protein BUY27_08345 [Staphylococcus cohnii]